MKKFTFLFSAMLAFTGLSAQTTQDDGKVVMVECIQMGISRPMSELFEENQNKVNSNFIELPNGMMESRDRENRIPQNFIETNEVDPIIQTEEGHYQAKVLVNWAGQSDGSCPPDPTGAVGLNHYIQAVNASPLKVFNKTTGAQVGSIRQIGSLWSPAVGNMGDPILLYDKFADRWFVSQFGASNKIYIAISTTNDPSGTYYTYTFTSPEFPDYLKFSIWQDGYYMTSNQTQKIFCFQRSQMILGLTPKSFYKTFSPHQGSGFFCPLPADADGQLPPAGTPCPIFSYECSEWGTGFIDAINIYSMTVNWAPTTPTATITSTQLPTQAFNGSYNGAWNDIAQPGSSQKLDGIGGVLNFRAQHRVWSGYNSVVLCWMVKISTTPAIRHSIRWCELRKTVPAGVWSIYQQGTYAPADSLNRWCGSIAMDDYGSIGMAYAVSGTSNTGASVYPSIRYTGRRNTDPLGTMSFAETVAIAGTSPAMTACGNRFGDYSHTSLDPSDGITFWHTGQYVSGGNPATRIFSFQIPFYVGIEEEKAQDAPGVVVYKSGFDLNINASHLPSNNQMVVDLFDINGQKVNGKTIVPVANSFQTSFNVTGLAAGTYLVRVGEPNTSFQKVTKVVIE
jgi:hypothetical protein